jgi:hypothetical protein
MHMPSQKRALTRNLLCQLAPFHNDCAEWTQSRRLAALSSAQRGRPRVAR